MVSLKSKKLFNAHNGKHWRGDMFKMVFSLFCLVNYLGADERFCFDVPVRGEYEREFAVNMNLPESDMLRVIPEVAIISKCIAGVMGGFCGRYLVSYYDISESSMSSMAIVTSVIGSMAAMRLLLDDQRVVHIANSAYRSCTRKIDQLAGDFIGE